MTTAITYLVLPAMTDMAGQLRIVCREHADNARPGLADYRANPDLWGEAGLVTAQSGRIVCFSGTREQFEDMKQDEPLRPPATFTYPIVRTT